MATLIKLKNADFSGQGLPNIEPIVSLASADFAFDFRSRANKLIDLAGKVTLTPYINDIAASNQRIVDPSVVTSADNGLGINIEMGYLETTYPLAAIPTDSSGEFSVLVVGGDSGITMDAGKIAGSTPSICSLLENGTGISANGFSLETQGSNAGTRIKSGGQVMGGAIPSLTAKVFMLLTYDGITWTLHNKTLGTIETKTNAELGIVGSLGVTTSYVSNIAFGHVHGSSTLGARYPSLYQTVRWNKVLSQTEIDDQYARSKSVFGSLGI